MPLLVMKPDEPWLPRPDEMWFPVRPLLTADEQWEWGNSPASIGRPDPGPIQARVLRGDSAYRWTGRSGDGVLDLGNGIRITLADLRRAVRFIETGERE